MSEPASNPSAQAEKLTLATHPPRTPRSLPSGSGAPPAAQPPARRPVHHCVVPLTAREWLLRGLLAVLVIGSVATLFWTYRRLLPVQRQAREAGALVSRLGSEIAVMEGRMSAQECEKLAADYLRAQALLFATPEALQDWFGQVRRDMVPLALDATADFGRPNTTNTARYALAIVPATLALNIQPAAQVEGVRSPYERVLRFLDRLNQQEKRVDLLDLQVSGGTNSVSRAMATLQLWAGEDRPQ